MSPLSNTPHLRARANTATAIISNLEFKTHNTRPTQPSAQPASLPRAIIMDSSTSPSPAVPSTTITETPSPQVKEEMSSGTKLGLGMIPVIIALCTICVFAVFWWRRRKARKADEDLETPPPVPEKDYVTRLPSLDSNRRGSKIFNMSAFSSHIYDGRHREAQVLGQSREYIRMVDQDQDEERVTLRTPPLSVKSEKVRSGRDSPIDGSSPFRLKRDDSLGRRSLGSEISEFWPSLPPTAWVRRQGILDSLPSSRFGRDMNRRSQHSDYKRRSDASSVF